MPFSSTAPLAGALASPLYIAGGWSYIALAAAIAPMIGLGVFLSGRK